MNELPPPDTVQKRVEYYDRVDDPPGKKFYLDKVAEELRRSRLLSATSSDINLGLSERQFLHSFVKNERARAEKEFTEWCLQKTRSWTEEEIEAAEAVLNTYEQLSRDNSGHPGITKIWEGANEHVGKGENSDHVQKLLAREELGYPEGHGPGTDRKVESLLTIASTVVGEDLSQKEKDLSRKV